MEALNETKLSPVRSTYFLRNRRSQFSCKVHDMAVRNDRIAFCGIEGNRYYYSRDIFIILLFKINHPDSPSPYLAPLNTIRLEPSFGSQLRHDDGSLLDFKNILPLKDVSFRDPSPLSTHYVSFLDDEHIVTVCAFDMEVYSTNGTLVHRRRILHEATCVTVSENIIYVCQEDAAVILFDFELNIIRIVTLEQMKVKWPLDIAVYGNCMYINAWSSGRPLKFSKVGTLLYAYNPPKGYYHSGSISVNGLVGVLWGDDRVDVYSLSDKLLMSVSVDHPCSKIRILNKFTLFTLKGNDVKLSEYTLTAAIEHFWLLKEYINVVLNERDCRELANYFRLSTDEVDVITNSDFPSKELLLALEERGVIHSANVNRLLEALHALKMNEAVLPVQSYEETIDKKTSYEIFLASLSTHLTLTLSHELSEYFKLSAEDTTSIITSNTPGITLLLILDRMGVINALNVTALETPLMQHQLMQAVSKVKEYQILAEDSRRVRKSDGKLEDKHALLLNCLKKTIKSWYETMTPIPWKKSCNWTSSELFIPCGLILTSSRSKLKTSQINPESKLQYRDVFVHRRLAGETRIIIEGDPGSGKTMLSSHIAYDWSMDKISNARMVIFLPLKFVEDMTIIEAIRKFYTKDLNLSENDIESLLNQASDEHQIWIILDGLEEYNPQVKNWEQSEIVKVMKKEKLAKCRIVLTSRSDFVHDLPTCPMLKLGSFGEEERNLYITKVYPDDEEKQQEVKETMKKYTFLEDLCRSPLLFVFVVHNMEQLLQLQASNERDTVGAFMEAVVTILRSNVKPYVKKHSQDEGESVKLSEIAFNGLCKGYQQLRWRKDFLDGHISDIQEWVESGILVLEEDLMITEKKEEFQYLAVAETNESVAKDEQAIAEDETTGVLKPETHIGLFDKQSDSGNMLQTVAMSVTEQPIPANSSFKSKTEKVAKALVPRKEQGGARKLPPDTPTNTSNSNPQNVSLTVRFLHKIMQEYFAAKHFATLFSQSQSDIILMRYLMFINPADLHYVLRFTTYLSPAVFPMIVEYLMNKYKTCEKTLPKHVQDSIFLCFMEISRPEEHPFVCATMRRVFKENLTIHGEDGMLLQMSKILALECASTLEIHVEYLTLVDLVVKVDETQLTFNSGLSLDFLPTLERAEISRWDQILKPEDYQKLIKFLVNCMSLTEAYLTFPSEPPPIKDRDTRVEIKWRKIKFEWIVGERLVHPLNWKTGAWDIEFRKTTQRYPKYSENNPAHSKRLGSLSESRNSGTQLADTSHPALSAIPSLPDVRPKRASVRSNEQSDKQSPLGVKKYIGKKGGVLRIADTNISLEVPSGAVKKKCLIQMRIITNPYQDESTLSFGGNSSVVVELLPRNLKLFKAATLTLPHCLLLEDGCDWRAMALRSHHKQGSPPEWTRDPDTHCILKKNECTMLLNGFSWETFEVDGKIVKGKNMQLYAANYGNRVQSPEGRMLIDVGYSLSLPKWKDMILKMNHVEFLRTKPFVFFKKGKLPLHILFEGTDPMVWRCEGNIQTISFKKVSTKPTDFCTYLLQKVDNGRAEECICLFKIWQMEDSEDLKFTLKANNKYQLIQQPQEQTTGASQECQPNHQLHDIPEHELRKHFQRLSFSESQVSQQYQKQSIKPHMVPHQQLYSASAPSSSQQYQRQDISDTQLIQKQSTTSPQVSPTMHYIQTPDFQWHSHSTFEVQDMPQIQLNRELRRPSLSALQVSHGSSEQVERSMSQQQSPLSVQHCIQDVSNTLQRQQLQQRGLLPQQGFFQEDALTLESHLNTQQIKRHDTPQDAQRCQEQAMLTSSDPPLVKQQNSSPNTTNYQEQDSFAFQACGRTLPGFSSEGSAVENLQSWTQTKDEESTTLRLDHLKKVDEKPLRNLSGEIKKEWRDLGTHLGLDDAALYNISQDTIGEHKERVYQMLLLWKQANGNNATYEVLGEALRKVGRRDLQEKLETLHPDK